MNCQKCSKETLNQKYCSRSCAAKENNKTPKRNAKIRNCRDCKNRLPTKRRKLFCEECEKSVVPTAEKWLNITLGEARARYTRNNISPSYAHALVRHHCHMLYAHLTSKCHVCEYTTHVELCHIKAISSFEESATFQEINATENIVGLCPNHHWELDNGKLLL